MATDAYDQQPESDPEEAEQLPTVVLVHGLYHRPEHFDAVARRVRTSGVDAVAPELHRGSLAADTEAVQSVVDSLEEPPLLLGHSYGGSVITGVRGACHLVYLAAFVLDTGESAAAHRGARVGDRPLPVRRAARSPRGAPAGTARTGAPLVGRDEPLGQSGAHVHHVRDHAVPPGDRAPDTPAVGRVRRRRIL
ncbi:alpha/beta fold hydrolase [Streptomyces sp. ms115]|uniref:alpha/beta fold hydrolase n=1 Tax=Streptomyces sp. ms115 TaxID=1827928 RepID=UPI00359C29D9